MVPAAASDGLVAPMVCPRRYDGVAAFKRHHHHWRRGDVFDQAGKKRPFAVHIVVFLRQFSADPQQLHTNDFQATLLEALDDFTGQTALDRIWFHDDQCPLQEIAFLTLSLNAKRAYHTSARDKCVC